MEKLYITQDKSGEWVKVDRELALELVNSGKKKYDDFKIHEVSSTAPPISDGSETSPAEQLRQQALAGTLTPEVGADLVAQDDAINEDPRIKSAKAQIAEPEAMAEHGRKLVEAREKRVEEGKATAKDKISRWLFTEEAATPLEAIGGASTILMRGAGALAQQGDFTEADTMILKEFKDDLKDWASSREAQNATADSMIKNLQSALDNYKNLPPDMIEQMQAQIDELEDGKNSGALTSAVDVVGSISLDVGSDPFFLVDMLKSALTFGKHIGRKVGRTTAKDVIDKANAAKLQTERNVGIPNKEFVYEVEKLPGKNVKEKLKYLRNEKVAKGAVQADGQFKAKYIQDQLETVDQKALQKELDALNDSFASSKRNVEVDAAITEKNLINKSDSEIRAAKAKFDKREEKLTNLAYAKEDEFRKRAIPNSAEAFISKTKKSQISQQKEMLLDEIKRIDDEIANTEVLGKEQKAEMIKALSDRKKEITEGLGFSVGEITEEASKSISKAKEFRDIGLEGVDEAAKKSIADVKSEVDLEESVGKITGNGEFSGKGTNKGFEASEKIGKKVKISEPERKELLNEMIAASKGDSKRVRDYSEIGSELWRSISKDAPIDEYKDLLKSQGIDPNLAETFRRIKQGNVHDLTESKKGILSAFDKSYGDLEDAMLVSADNYKKAVQEAIDRNISKEGAELLATSRKLGGDQKEAVEYFKSLAKLGNENTSFVDGTKLENAVYNLDNSFDDIAVKYFKTGKMPSAKLDQLNRVLGIKAKEEVMARVKRLKIAEESVVKKKVLANQTKESISKIKDERYARKKAAKEASKLEEKIAVEKSGEAISNSMKSIEKRIEKLSKDKAPNVEKIKKLEAKLSDLKDVESRKLKGNIAKIEEEKRSFTRKLRSLRSKMKANKEKIIGDISKSKSESIADNRILASDKLEDIQKAYNARSSEIQDAIRESGKKLTVWNDFKNIVSHYATDGSFNMEDELVKKFREDYGDKLADLIPDAGIMSVLDIEADGKVKGTSSLINTFKGVSAVGAPTGAREAKTGADIINKLHSLLLPYSSRLESAFKKFKKIDVATAKRLNKMKKKNGPDAKAALEMMRNENPLISADILASEFKFFDPLTFVDKATITAIANSTGREYTNRERMAARRLLARMDRKKNSRQ